MLKYDIFYIYIINDSSKKVYYNMVKQIWT